MESHPDHSNKDKFDKTERQDKEKKAVIGITHGDFNGISYEVIIKTFMEPRMLEICTPVVYGSSKIASYHRKALNINEFNFNLIRKAEGAPAKRANIINVTDQEVKIDLGESSETAGKLAVSALDMAVEDLKSGHINALVTAPINKKNIQSPSFDFKGHTEYLAEKFHSNDFMMMMVSDKIRIGFVTGHSPIKDVAKDITVENVMRKLIILNNSLIRDFGIRRPKIAVLGLNPHAGDRGVIGNEEDTVIGPAVRKASSENILAFGPYPADGFFAATSFKDFDGILAMYHDQGMIAFKLLAFDSGVNFTAGLPYVRTSPAHGTAYEIAGKNEANPESFRHAVFMAIDIWNQRKEYDELHANPLPYKSPSNDEPRES
jgi:4-hydroxythreonine-4-phosphate dehydrogenase